MPLMAFGHGELFGTSIRWVHMTITLQKSNIMRPFIILFCLFGGIFPTTCAAFEPIYCISMGYHVCLESW